MYFFILPFRVQDHCLSLPKAVVCLGEIRICQRRNAKGKCPKNKNEKRIKKYVLRKVYWC